MIKRYEYFIDRRIILPTADQLDELGANGWELVSIIDSPNANAHSYILFFKREIT